jgi:hypothetical protein
MHLLDRYLPEPRLRQIDRVAVSADTQRTWAAVRDADLYRLKLARRLFALRALPERMVAAVRGRPAPVPATARIDEFTAGPGGFRILGEEVPYEIAVGAIGKFWQPAIEFVDVAPDRFATFAEPGFGKVAWSIRVEPREDGGSWIVFDLRVDATDEDAWVKFRRYWLLIGRFSHVMRRGLLHVFGEDLGHPMPEDARVLPGDELLPVATFQNTEAITIEAPPARVFPWLVQMGRRRGGWYSYDRLDNGGVPSADHLEPSLQHLAVGDVLPVRAEGEDGFAVLRLEEPKVLVLGAPSLLGDGRAPPEKPEPYLGTWAFVLEPIGDDATRLLVRVRAESARGVYPALLRVLIPPVHRFMQAEQLRNLKKRAERGVST